jgi:hypothetical protein
MKEKEQTAKSKVEPLRRRKREKSKKFEQYELTKPIQLTLFDLDASEESYSQSIELYDFMPKYIWGKVDRIEGLFLKRIERKFECRGKSYTIKIDPAKVEDADGEARDYYLSKREELVEDALRKLMIDKKSIMLDGEAGVCFTLYQLREELKHKGHSLSYDQLKEALEVLKKVDIEIESEDKEVRFFFSPIETLGLKGKGSETQTFVRFSPLVTESIRQGTFRLINYDKVMSYRSVIARQLHKRMSHHFIQASLTETYEILLTTVIRDFGLTLQKRIQQNLVEVENAVEEMKQKNVILNCKIDKIFDLNPKRKLIDVKLKFQPHSEFAGDIKRANAKAKRVRGLIQ